LNIGLWIEQEKLKIIGMVKTCDPVFGNGIQFLEMSDEAREQLKKYLDNGLKNRTFKRRLVLAFVPR